MESIHLYPSGQSDRRADRTSLYPGSERRIRRDGSRSFLFLTRHTVFDQMWDRNIRPYYVKKRKWRLTCIQRSGFPQIAYGFHFGAFVCYGGFFSTGVKIQMELPSWEWENRFLMQMGMTRKERKRKNPLSDAYQDGASTGMWDPAGNALFCADRQGQTVYDWRDRRIFEKYSRCVRHFHFA